jgi:hypothetical protein
LLAGLALLAQGLELHQQSVMPQRLGAWRELVAAVGLRCPLRLRSLLPASRKWVLPKSRPVSGLLVVLVLGLVFPVLVPVLLDQRRALRLCLPPSLKLALPVVLVLLRLVLASVDSSPTLLSWAQGPEPFLEAAPSVAVLKPERSKPKKAFRTG